MDYKEALDNAYVINMPKRKERLDLFLQRYKKATSQADKLKIAQGFDGTKLPKPPGNEATEGAFGCCFSHIVAWARALTETKDITDETPLMFFEDDAVFCDNFETKLYLYGKHLPDDWDVAYLGGEHIRGKRREPTVVYSDDEITILKGYNINRLHAYIVKAGSFKKIFPRLLAYSTNAPKRNNTPSGNTEVVFDWEFGRMSEEGLINVYAPKPWFCGQGAFGSDTYPDSSALKVRYWNI